MSNNKQNMKLYTEEQVRQALMKHQNAAMLLSSEQIDYLIEEITPIELPSDEEMSVRALKTISELNPKLRENEEAFYIAGFEDGAKWMRDKIGGNK